MGDLIALIVRLSQTMLTSRLAFSNEVECSVMEVGKINIIENICALIFLKEIRVLLY